MTVFSHERNSLYTWLLEQITYPSVVENIHSAYLSSCLMNVCVHGSTNHQLIKAERRD